MDNSDNERVRLGRVSTPQAVTQISFTDRTLDTVQVRDADVVRVEDRGVWLTRNTYKGAWTSFYPWSSVFSLTYA